MSRMVLIPEKDYLLMKKPTVKHEYKATLQSILQGKRDRDSAKKMSQLIGQYLRTKQSIKPMAKPEQQQKSAPPQKEAENIEETILKYISPIYHNKVKLLIKEIHNYGVNWNNKMELVLLDGSIVKRSHIVDLIKEALVVSRRKTRGNLPDGWPQFIQVLSKLPLPRTFFTKQTTKSDIEGAKEESEELQRQQEIEYGGDIRDDSKPAQAWEML